MDGRRRHEDTRGTLIGGLIVAGIGVFFLLQNLDLIPDIGRMWPVIPIIVGVAMIVGSLSRIRKPDGPG